MKYTVVLQREKDGGYAATVPALPGCVSQGDSREEALRNIGEAIELYLEDIIRPPANPFPARTEGNTSKLQLPFDDQAT